MHKNHIFRSSWVGNIVPSCKFLSEKQELRFAELYSRYMGNGKPLTENMKLEYYRLKLKEEDSKNPKLTDGIKKLLSTLVMDLKQGRKSEIKNKFLTKGNAVEKESRDILSQVLGVFLTYDPERKNNKWVTGMRDIKEDAVFDIKSTWSRDTYNSHVNDIMPHLYASQLDSYMDLWGLDESYLCYVLTDTPPILVDDELRRLDWRENTTDVGGMIRENCIEMVKDIVYNLIYTRQRLEEYCHMSPNINIDWFDDFIEIPEKDRVHIIPHPYDQQRIDWRNESISKAREYMDTVKVFNNHTL